MITADQLAQVQASVNTVVAAKIAADKATADKNASDVALQSAQADNAAKGALEAQASAQLASDVAALQRVVDVLTMAPAPGAPASSSKSAA